MSDEFRAEVGSIPPSFLPICNQRLFEFQVKAIKEAFQTDEKVLLSLPLSFKVDEKDRVLLNKLGIETVFLPDNLSIGESIYEAIQLCDGKSGVKILYGDTFFNNIPVKENIVSIGTSYENYDWKAEFRVNKPSTVWSGYFSFSSKKVLENSLKSTNFDYILAIDSLMSYKKLKLSFIDGWFDLGHLNLYFRARSRFTSERSFNSLKIDKNIVTKKSAKREKVLGEARWFQDIPCGLKRLTPSFFSMNSEREASYSIEYLYHMPLNELAVHGRLPESSWVQIIKSCKEYFSEVQSYKFKPTKEQKVERESLIKHKTFERVELYKKHSPIKFDTPVLFNGVELDCLNLVIDELIRSSMKTPALFSVFHGDFCFSNIIFDNRAKTIKLIDPRALTSSGKFSIYGDVSYDLAKFYHSVIGFYDFIISGSYSLLIRDQSIQFEIFVSEEFLKVKESVKNITLLDGYTVEMMMPQVILLFFSMLPLHSDNPERQSALLANALRLYCDFRSLK